MHKGTSLVHGKRSILSGLPFPYDWFTKLITMSDFQKAVKGNILACPEYIQWVEQLVSEDRISGHKQTEALAGFTVLDLRIIFRDDNPELMNRYLTNGSKSIPKLIAFDKANSELFTWGRDPNKHNDYYWIGKQIPIAGIGIILKKNCTPGMPEIKLKLFSRSSTD